MPALAEAAGVARVLVKDESSRMGLPAFKILGASWATYRVLVRPTGCGRDGGRAPVGHAPRPGGDGGPAAGTAPTGGGHRRQPRPGGGADGQAPRPVGDHPGARRHRPGPHRRHRRRGRRGDGGAGHLRRRRGRVGGPGQRARPGHLRHVVAGLRGPAAPGDRGLRHDLRRARGRSSRRWTHRRRTW